MQTSKWLRERARERARARERERERQRERERECVCERKQYRYMYVIYIYKYTLRTVHLSLSCVGSSRFNKGNAKVAPAASEDSASGGTVDSSVKVVLSSIPTRPYSNLSSRPAPAFGGVATPAVSPPGAGAGTAGALSGDALGMIVIGR